MNRNPEIGNSIILHTTAVLLAAASLYLNWGSYRGLGLDGRSGFIPLMGLNIPAWLAVWAVILGIGISGSNQLGFSSIHRRALRWLFFSAGILLPGILMGYLIDKGRLDIGGFLLIAAAITGLRQQRMSQF